MPLDPSEIVTHFIFGKRKIKRKVNYIGVSEISIQPSAFEPEPNRNDLSVFQISDIKPQSDIRSIWFIGKFVERVRQDAHLKKHGTDGTNPTNMYGRGDLSVQQIQELGLHVEPNSSPPRHANITEFPPFNREKNSASFNTQQKLADRAEGFLSSEVSPEITDILNEDVAVRHEFSSLL